MALIPISVPSQELPTLPASKNISSGSLANGIRYYIVTNPAYKGMVDIALVQRTGSGDETDHVRGSATVNARGSLSDLPHFSQTTPFSFLRGKSILPGKNGYAKVASDASVYRFDNLVQARKADLVDSTLLLVFDIIGKEHERMGEYYSPQDQAIIISGDVDEASVRGKMDMLSMFVPKREAIERSDVYEWKDSEGPLMNVRHSWSSNMVAAEYRYPRTPQSSMATVLPLVTSRYTAELEIILRKRLAKALAAEGIAYSAIDFTYSSSSDRAGDEIIRTSISTSKENLEKAAGILASTLSGLDSDGCSEAEFNDAENELMMRLSSTEKEAMVDNASYVDRCIAAFLYGSSLASEQDNLRFFSSRNVDLSTSTRLFNNFVSALLDKSRNLTIVCETLTDETTETRLRRSFDIGWGNTVKSAYRSHSADTLALRKPSGKAKIRQITPEPLSEGEMWTFTNGIKVIYKKVPGGGYFNYSWLVKGGYSYMQDLHSGESAFLGDMPGTFRIGNLSGEDFCDMLRSNGVTMDIDVSVSEMNISGVARSSKLQLLMKSLLSMAKDRKADPQAFRQYRDNEQLRIASQPATIAKLDSIMNKEVALSAYKRQTRLADDFQTRAMKYYDGVFSRMNDGALIIVGDIDENTLKKVLLQYLGSFGTDKAYTYRSRNRRGVISSRSTVTAWGHDPLIGVELSAPINYTAESFMAANIAALAMEDAVATAIAPSGWALQSEHEVRMFPEESLTIDMIMDQASSDGLPASMMREDSADVVIEKVRMAIEQIGSKGISADMLKVGKTIMYNRFESWKSDPQSMIRMLVLRYSYGKDLITDYKAKITSVNASAVNPILASLASGGIAEYMVRKTDTKGFVEAVVKDEQKLVVPDLKPVLGTVYYPYDGSKVPFDTLDIHDLDNLPEIDAPADTAAILIGDIIREDAMNLVEEGEMAASEEESAEQTLQEAEETE